MNYAMEVASEYIEKANLCAKEVYSLYVMYKRLPCAETRDTIWRDC